MANEQLRGKTDLERAEVIQWFGFADSEILPASCAWLFPLLGIMQYNKQVFLISLIAFMEKLFFLNYNNNLLQRRTVKIFHFIVRNERRKNNYKGRHNKYLNFLLWMLFIRLHTKFLF